MRKLLHRFGIPLTTVSMDADNIDGDAKDITIAL